MNKVGATPNGPGPSLAEQAKFVNGKGARLIGAPDSPRKGFLPPFEIARLRQLERAIDHEDYIFQTARRLGKIIGTASRH